MQAFWETIVGWWTEYGVPFKIILIIISAVIARWVLLALLKRTVTQVVTGVKKSQDVTQTVEITQSPLLAARMVQRTRTLGSVGKNFITSAVVVVTLIMILNQLGVNITAVLASAGFIAAGLAFGAQNLVKDLLNGIFIVFEDQLGVGDSITIGNITGVVEVVGLRVTQVRAQDGTLWFIRNGEIMQLGNKSYGWSRCLMHIDVEVDSSAANAGSRSPIVAGKKTLTIAEVQDIITRSAVEAVLTPEVARKTLEMPEILEVEAIQPDYVTYLLGVKTRTGASNDVASAIRVALSRDLTAHGINIGPLLK